MNDPLQCTCPDGVVMTRDSLNGDMMDKSNRDSLALTTYLWRQVEFCLIHNKVVILCEEIGLGFGVVMDNGLMNNWVNE